MPVLKIFFDEDLTDDMRTTRKKIQSGLESMMRDILKADPDKCEVLMISVLHASPKPVYVDMQFRANTHRSPAVVAEAMQEVVRILAPALGVALRIRAFDIDQAGLHALDTDGPDKS